MPELSDKELIVLARRGDMKAFEQLVFRYEKPIFGFVFRFINHKENAEDVTQEIFIKVYRSLKTFDPEYKFKTWLYTVATNTVYDWLRKAKKSLDLYIIDDPEIGFETIDKIDSYKIMEDKELINNLLQTLKPAYQNVVLLYFRDGFTYEEIGTILKIPINTVKTHLRRAKKLLSEELKKQI